MLKRPVIWRLPKTISSNRRTRAAHAFPAAVLGRGSHVSWVYQGGAGRLRRLITTDVPDKVHQVGEDGLEGHRRA
jgi:hypothetical protein